MSDEYRLFYIGGALQHWPGPGGLEYDVGDRLLLTENPRHLGEEWGSPRRTCWWHFRKSAPVYVHLHDAVEGQALFEAVLVATSDPIPVSSALPIQLFVNGTPATIVEYVPAAHDRLGAIAGDLLKIGLNTFTCTCPRPHIQQWFA